MNTNKIFKFFDKHIVTICITLGALMVGYSLGVNSMIEPLMETAGWKDAYFELHEAYLNLHDQILIPPLQ